ncbi:MAG: hypothetical protein HY575_02775 [candidate division NC10 bacterium]|nr:hypothetical protein [candidate division NC10 bacterium]
MRSREQGQPEREHAPRRQPRAVLVATLLVGLAAGDGASRAAAPEAASESVSAFLERHWTVPIPLQGPPPARFSPLEASLAPEACGACHAPQFADWKTSHHSQSMGPGVRGQTVVLVGEEPETARLCYTCHAPLSEQQEVVSGVDGLGFAGLVENPHFDRGLQEKGLTCAGCHVRGHERFGPPRRVGSPASPIPRDQLPHNGVTRTPAFRASEFCKGCHQFGPDGYALNGKLLEDTYNEWRAGPYAARGIQCQDCHMPGRRHLWRGIHDPDMVRQGVRIRVGTGKKRYAPGESLTATLTVTNTGVGHLFPTYVTPKVVARISLVDGSGRTEEGSLQEDPIGREVTLDLTRELYDTRIPPGKAHTVTYRRKVSRAGLRLRASVVVYPDSFYTRFFEARLAADAEGPGASLLREALEKTRRSAFPLFEEERPIS